MLSAELQQLRIAVNNNSEDKERFENQHNFWDNQGILFEGLKQIKKLQEIDLATFDIETFDGLNGCELFDWSFYHADINGKSHKILKQFKEKNKNNENKFAQSYESIKYDNESLLYSEKNYDRLFDYFKFRKNYYETKLKNKNRKYQTLYVYIHNLSFEIRSLIYYCREKKIKYTHITPHSNSLMLFLTDLNVKFIDSWQFLLCPQEKAEKTFQIDKKIRKKQTISTKTIFEKWSNNEKRNDKGYRRTVRIHNWNDVKALHAVMNKFRKMVFERFNVDILNFNTLASLSKGAYRKFMKQNNITIKNPYIYQKWITDSENNHKLTYAIDKERYMFVNEAYYGGRTEIFKSGSYVDENNQYIPVCSLDINSSYPFQMYNGQFPLGISHWVYNTHNENYNFFMDIIKENLPFQGFIEADICPIKNELYPCLPDRVKLNGQTNIIFGSYQRTSVYSVSELQYAYKQGYLILPIKGLIFEEYGNPFAKYIKPIYEERKITPNEALKYILKIFMNSLYGKFAEAILRDSIIKEEFIFSEIERDMFYEELEFNEIYIEKIESIEMKDSDCMLLQAKSTKILPKSFKLVHLSAYITANGRLQLVNKMLECQQLGIEVIYSDTDSIWIPYEKYQQHFQDNYELGGWKLEHIGKEAIFLGLKRYIYGSEEKGYNITFNGLDKRIKRKFEGKNEEYKYQKELLIPLQNINKILHQKIIMPSKYLPLKSAIRSGYILNAKERPLNPKYNQTKRIFDINGNSIPISKFSEREYACRIKPENYDKLEFYIAI